MDLVSSTSATALILGVVRKVVLLDAPSNLGLRPPVPATVPGCYKLAGALRDQRLLERLGASEGGVVVPPRYDRGDWKQGDGVFNAHAIADYTRRLADRLDGHVRAGEFPVVLGGTAAFCSEPCSQCAASAAMGSLSSMDTLTSGTLAIPAGATPPGWGLQQARTLGCCARLWRRRGVSASS
jgi:hypothetical protein